MSNAKHILLFKKLEASFLDYISEDLDLIKILVNYGSKEDIFDGENSKEMKALLRSAISEEINEFSIFEFFNSIYLIKLGECFKGIEYFPVCKEDYDTGKINSLILQIYQEGKILEQESNRKFKLFNSLKRLSPEKNLT